nr:MAG TPA: hypothetical protein [Caudoviricetes sp.]
MDFQLGLALGATLALQESLHACRQHLKLTWARPS